MSKPSTEVDVLDLGDQQVPKGTPVIAQTVSGRKVKGTLHSVDHRDGITTASIWTGRVFRQVYADTVEVKS